VLFCATALLWAMREVSNRQLARDAEHAALQYAQFVAASVPDLEAAFAGRGFSAAALEKLRWVRHLGDVFRFKLFDPQGRQLLVSDDLAVDTGQAPEVPALLGTEDGERNAHVRQAVLGGHNHIELKDGSATPGRPLRYSEAYVPLMRAGQLLGVIEVYVDQSARVESNHAAYALIAVAVAGVLALLGVLAGMQWLHRMRQQSRAEAQAKYLAEHDVLSGALNRTSFHDALQQAAWRQSADGPRFAVLSIDLDRFKEINDTLGPAVGDAMLRQVAQRLRAQIPPGDVVARLDGDEFAVLQGGVRTPDDVSALGQRLACALAQPYEMNGQAVHGGASVGAALFGTDARDSAGLLRCAGVALHRAKANGRGGFSFYDASLDAQLDARRALTRELRHAIEHDELSLHYQPLFSAQQQALLGYEALLRWQHPTRGAILPAEFVALAEDTGLIEPLGRWVLRRACAQAVLWPAPLSVAVNLSPAQFRDGQLADLIERTLAETGLHASRLEVKITESLLIANTEQVIVTLKKVACLGVRIAMDDFGTGYSSLAYLWRFPFDKLKIDRAFTQGLGTDAKVSLIVRSIISLAHAMGIRVNAEGVETVGQLRALRKHGCDELQGFLLGRPQPAELLTHADGDADTESAPLDALTEPIQL
jgi:diguanylate cyclase (GGDEF)-like protein